MTCQHRCYSGTHLEKHLSIVIKMFPWGARRLTRLFLDDIDYIRINISLRDPANHHERIRQISWLRFECDGCVLLIIQRSRNDVTLTRINLGMWQPPRLHWEVVHKAKTFHSLGTWNSRTARFQHWTQRLLHHFRHRYRLLKGLETTLQQCCYAGQTSDCSNHDKHIPKHPSDQFNWGEWLNTSTCVNHGEHFWL